MNTDNPPPDPTPDEPGPGENQERPKKKPRRHLLGLPPGYRFDPNARPTLDDLYGTPACFGDDEPSRRGEGRTECDGPSVGV